MFIFTHVKATVIEAPHRLIRVCISVDSCPIKCQMEGFWTFFRCLLWINYYYNFMHMSVCHRPVRKTFWFPMIFLIGSRTPRKSGMHLEFEDSTYKTICMKVSSEIFRSTFIFYPPLLGFFFLIFTRKSYCW